MVSDPTLRPRILAALKARLSELSPRMRVAAKYIVDHPSDFGLDPIRVTAQRAGVSTYTFVKVAEKIGLSGYEEMRRPFRYALVSSPVTTDSVDAFSSERESGALGVAYADAAENAVSIVARSLQNQSLEDLERIADTLISARRVYVTAVRASYAIAYYLHYVGTMALPSMELIPRHMNSAIDDLITATSDDVLIAVSVTPYSRETVEACKYAQSKGMKLLYISDSEIVTPDLVPDFTIVTSVQSTHSFGCFSGMMAVVDLLLSLLMHEGGDGAQDRIRSYEKLRLENNAYWAGQKKH